MGNQIVTSDSNELNRSPPVPSLPRWFWWLSSRPSTACRTCAHIQGLWNTRKGNTHSCQISHRVVQTESLQWTSVLLSQAFLRNWWRFRSGSEQVTKTDTDRVWIVEIADLAGHILTGGACAHWSHFGLFTGVYDVALWKQLVEISIKVPATPCKCSSFKQQADQS